MTAPSLPTRPMVFGIGLSKTGTTSLHRALQILGYRSMHYPPAATMLDHDWSTLEGFDAASDISVAVVYRELHEAFSGSKFILTVRDETSWLASCEQNFQHELDKYDGLAEEEVFVRAYGVNRFDRAAFIEASRRHESTVREHFAERPGDLLIMNITKGDGWSRLCDFLGVSAPDVPFPAENRTDASSIYVEPIAS